MSSTLVSDVFPSQHTDGKSSIDAMPWPKKIEAPSKRLAEWRDPNEMANEMKQAHAARQSALALYPKREVKEVKTELVDDLFQIDPKLREQTKRGDILRKIVHKHAQHLQFRNEQQLLTPAQNTARAVTECKMELARKLDSAAVKLEMEMDMRAEVERRLLQVANETRLRRSAEEEKKQAAEKKPQRHKQWHQRKLAMTSFRGGLDSTSGEAAAPSDAETSPSPRGSPRPSPHASPRPVPLEGAKLESAAETERVGAPPLFAAVPPPRRAGEPIRPQHQRNVRALQRAERRAEEAEASALATARDRLLALQLSGPPSAPAGPPPAPPGGAAWGGDSLLEPPHAPLGAGHLSPRRRAAASATTRSPATRSGNARASVLSEAAEPGVGEGAAGGSGQRVGGGAELPAAELDGSGRACGGESQGGSASGDWQGGSASGEPQGGATSGERQAAGEESAEQWLDTALELHKAVEASTASLAQIKPRPRHEPKQFRYLQGPDSGDISLSYPTSVDPPQIIKDQQNAKLPYSQIAPFKQGWMRINAASAAAAAASGASAAGGGGGSSLREKHALFLPTPPVIDDLVPIFGEMPAPIMEVDFPADALLPTGTDLDDDPLGKIEQMLGTLVSIIFKERPRAGASAADSSRSGHEASPSPGRMHMGVEGTQLNAGEGSGADANAFAAPNLPQLHGLALLSQQVMSNKRDAAEMLPFEPVGVLSGFDLHHLRREERKAKAAANKLAPFPGGHAAASVDQRDEDAADADGATAEGELLSSVRRGDSSVRRGEFTTTPKAEHNPERNSTSLLARIGVEIAATEQAAKAAAAADEKRKNKAEGAARRKGKRANHVHEEHADVTARPPTELDSVMRRRIEKMHHVLQTPLEMQVRYAIKYTADGMGGALQNSLALWEQAADAIKAWRLIQHKGGPEEMAIQRCLQVAAKLEQQCGDVATFRGEPFTELFRREEAPTDDEEPAEGAPSAAEPSKDGDSASDEDPLDKAQREQDEAASAPDVKRQESKGEPQTQAALAGAAKALFESIDLDGDGSISQADMNKCLEELGLEGERVTELFAAVDVDKSGFIDYGEFGKVIFHAKKMASAALTQELRAASPGGHAGVALGSQPPIA